MEIYRLSVEYDHLTWHVIIVDQQSQFCLTIRQRTRQRLLSMMRPCHLLREKWYLDTLSPSSSPPPSKKKKKKQMYYDRELPKFCALHTPWKKNMLRQRNIPRSYIWIN